MTSQPPHRAPIPGATSCTAKRCLLVATRLAPDIKPAAVAEILKRTRDLHRQLEITGAILFDGESFGLLLCGTHDQVTQALGAVTVDPHQTMPVVLADAKHVPPWAARGWRSGWSEPDALASLTADSSPRGDGALAAWQTLIGASDLL